MNFSLGKIKDAFQKSDGTYENFVSNLIGSQDLEITDDDLDLLFPGIKEFAQELESL